MSLRAREPESPSRSPHPPGWVHKVLRERERERKSTSKNVQREEIFHFLVRFSVLHWIYCVCSYCSCCCHGFLITCQTDGLTDRQSCPCFPFPCLVRPWLDQSQVKWPKAWRLCRSRSRRRHRLRHWCCLRLGLLAVRLKVKPVWRPYGRMSACPGLAWHALGWPGLAWPRLCWPVL